MSTRINNEGTILQNAQITCDFCQETTNDTSIWNNYVTFNTSISANEPGWRSVWSSASRYARDACPKCSAHLPAGWNIL